MNEPAPTPDADGWITWPCSAGAGGPNWNRIQLPADWIEVQVYVSLILWFDGNNSVTKLADTSDHGLQYNGTKTVGNNNPLTSTDVNSPQLITVDQPPGILFSATTDSDVDDNYGGYILKVRKKPGS